VPEEYAHFPVIERVSKLEVCVELNREHWQDMLAEMDKRYEQRFQAQKSATEAALASTSQAIEKSDRSTELRFDSVNEFRTTLSDQARDFARNSDIHALNEKIGALTGRLDRSEGKGSGLNSGWGYLVGAACFVAALVAVYVAFRH
jgi:hypothetical protein